MEGTKKNLKPWGEWSWTNFIRGAEMTSMAILGTTPKLCHHILYSMAHYLSPVSSGDSSGGCYSYTATRKEEFCQNQCSDLFSTDVNEGHQWDYIHADIITVYNCCLIPHLSEKKIRSLNMSGEKNYYKVTYSVKERFFHTVLF